MLQLVLVCALVVPQVTCLRTRGPARTAVRNWVRQSRTTRYVSAQETAETPRKEAAANAPAAQLGTTVALPVLPAADSARAQSSLRPEQPPESPAAGNSEDVTSNKPSTERGKPAVLRMPRYFARLELDDDQTQRVLAIQQKFAEQEVLLQRQLSELQSQRDQELKKVLNRTQQRKLSQLMERPRS